MYSILRDSLYGDRIWKRVNIYVYVCLVYFAAHLKLTHLSPLQSNKIYFKKKTCQEKAVCVVFIEVGPKEWIRSSRKTSFLEKKRKGPIARPLRAVPITHTDPTQQVVSDGSFSLSSTSSDLQNSKHSFARVFIQLFLIFISTAILEIDMTVIYLVPCRKLKIQIWNLKSLK